MIGSLNSVKAAITGAFRSKPPVTLQQEQSTTPGESFTMSQTPLQSSVKPTVASPSTSETRNTGGDRRMGTRTGLMVALTLCAGLSGCASMGGGPQSLENMNCTPVTVQQQAPAKGHKHKANAPQVIVCEQPSMAHELGSVVHNVGSGLYHGLLVPIGHQVDNFAHGVAGKPERFR